MSEDRVSKSNQIEIKDLISESIANAVERRKSSLDSKEFLSELSDDEAKGTMGGQVVIDSTLGYVGHPPA